MPLPVPQYLCQRLPFSKPQLLNRSTCTVFKLFNLSRPSGNSAPRLHNRCLFYGRAHCLRRREQRNKARRCGRQPFFSAARHVRVSRVPQFLYYCRYTVDSLPKPNSSWKHRTHRPGVRRTVCHRSRRSEMPWAGAKCRPTMCQVRNACRRGSCASLKGPRRTWRRGARTRWGMTTLPALPYRSWPWCNGFHHAFRYRSCAHGSTCGTLAPPLVVQRWRALRCGVRVAYSRACVMCTRRRACEQACERACLLAPKNRLLTVAIAGAAGRNPCSARCNPKA